MPLSDIHYTLMQVKSICFKKNSFLNPKLWIFLDEDRISDESSFLRGLPSSRLIGVIVRTKKKKYLYKKAKLLGKICKLKGFKFYVSSDPLIALSTGADGVHFSKYSISNRVYSSLSYSCSFHNMSDLRRTRNLKVKKVFISPIFETSSCNTKKPVGLTRLLFLSRSLRCEIGVLGGINIKNIKKLRKKKISYIGGVDIFLFNKR